jgi:hypothetical protein
MHEGSHISLVGVILDHTGKLDDVAVRFGFYCDLRKADKFQRDRIAVSMALSSTSTAITFAP